MTTTRPARSPRLPVTTSGPSRRQEVLRGLLALAATALIVVGVPLALLAAFGNPLPTSAPSRDWLTAQISTSTLLRILALVVWLAWAHFVICLVIEAVTERRSAGLSPRVPGGAVGTQALARRLVAAVLLLAGTATATVSTASAVTGGAPPRAGAAETHAAPPAGSALAPPRHSAEPERLTRAITGAEGVVKYYEVRPPQGRHYDSLWDIAERYLGSGLRYKEIYELNRGVLQPDGRRLVDADLIQPGWLMRLPGDANGPGIKVVDHTEPQGHGRGGSFKNGQPAGQRGVEQPEAPPADRPTGAHRTVVDASADLAWGPTLGTAGGLIAAGLLVGLRRRRAGLAGRPLIGPDDPEGGPSDDPQGDPEGPGGGRSAVEKELRLEADAPAAQMLSAGLRAWPAGAPDGVVPRPAQCSVSPHGVAVSFDEVPEVEPPRPWTSQRDGRVWVLRRDHLRRLPAAAGALSPLPALVSLGRRDDGSILLLDLESQPGVVSVGGDPSVARAIAMSWAIDMAVHAWADAPRVTLVGFADDPSALAVDSLRCVDDLALAIDSVATLARRQRAACERLGVDSARTGRCREPDPELWACHLVVCSGVPDDEAFAVLEELAARPDNAVAVVVVGDHTGAAARLTTSPDGRLSSRLLGVDVMAQRLSVEAYRGAIDLFKEELPVASGGTDEAAWRQASAAVALDDSVLDLDVRQPVEIGILGPVAVEADGPVDDDRRDLLSEIVVFVAAHPGGVHPQLLKGAVWPRGISSESFDATLRAAQQWLGRDEHGELRLRLDNGRWTLSTSGVRFDWDVFRFFVNRSVDPLCEAVTSLRSALSLVRGEPWIDLPAGRYSWLAHDRLQHDPVVAVVLVARRIAALCAESGDAAGARDALLRGLSVAPAAEDLWCDALRLAAHLGHRSDVKAVADSMYAAIASHGSPLGATAQTDELVEELLPGYRRSAA